MCDHARPHLLVFRLHFLSKSGNDHADNPGPGGRIEHNRDQKFCLQSRNPDNQDRNNGHWMNQDGAVHQIASDSGIPVAFTSDSLANRASYQFTFTQPGTYTYYCMVHPSMKGTIIVQS